MDKKSKYVEYLHYKQPQENKNLFCLVLSHRLAETRLALLVDFNVGRLYEGGTVLIKLVC